VVAENEGHTFLLKLSPDLQEITWSLHMPDMPHLVSAESLFVAGSCSGRACIQEISHEGVVLKTKIFGSEGSKATSLDYWEGGLWIGGTQSNADTPGFLAQFENLEDWGSFQITEIPYQVKTVLPLTKDESLVFTEDSLLLKYDQEHMLEVINSLDGPIARVHRGLFEDLWIMTIPEYGLVDLSKYNLFGSLLWKSPISIGLTKYDGGITQTPNGVLLFTRGFTEHVFLTWYNESTLHFAEIRPPGIEPDVEVHLKDVEISPAGGIATAVGSVGEGADEQMWVVQVET
jgi:hypothetical protein